MALSHSLGITLAASTLLAALPAYGGLDVKTRTVGAGADGGSSRMRTQGDHLRIDTVAPPSGAGATSMIFDAGSEVLYIVRHGDRTYVEIDKDFARALGEKMAQAQKLMQEQLEKMPPDQRAMMEKMMKGGAMPFPKPGETKKREPLAARDTGEGDTVDGKPCSVFALSRGNESKGDVCVASWDTAGIQPADIEVVKKLGTFQARMTESFAGAMPGAEQPFELLERVDGFPLRTRRSEDGKVTSETFFEEIVETEVPSDVFEVPENYAKKQLGTPGSR